MLRTTFKSLVAHKFRLFATSLAVMLGVAFMAGTLVLTDTIQKTFDDLFSNVYDDTDAVVRAEGAFDSAGIEQRGRLDASLLDTVSDVDGVDVAQPDIRGYAQLVDKDGDAVGDPENGPPTLGGNWIDSEELNGFEISDGSPPSADDEVVIDKKSADDTGYRVGDTAQVLVKGGPQDVTIAGIAQFGDADSPGGASFVLFTLDAAQRLIAEPDKFDGILVIADDGISPTEIVQRIAPELPTGTEAVTGDEVTQESQDEIKQGLSFFNTFMFVFAAIALLVGGFIIFNTFFITVAQRTRENALLRALGAKKRQVLVSVLVEALAVGLIASVVGIGVGVLVAAGLKTLLAAFGFELPGGGIVLTPNTVIISLVAGVGVTLVAAISPARRAGKVPPVAAMREVAVGSTGYGSKQRIIVGSALLVLGGAALGFGLFGSAGSPFLMVGVGVLLVFFGVAALGRTVALPLSRSIGWPLPRLFGIRGRLARENAMRNPRRTAATASAVMIGVGLVAFISIFAASAKASFGTVIDRAFTGDFVITSPAGLAAGGLDPELAASLNELPEVDAAGAIRAGVAEIDGSATQVLAASDEAFDVVDVDPVAGSSADLGADTIAVFEDVAKDKNLSIGDTVPVVFKDTGAQELTVALIYGESQPAGDWLLGTETYEANVDDQYDYQVFVRKADGVDTPTARAAIEEVADGYPGAKVLDQSGYEADQTMFIDQLLGLIYVMLLLAIFIALLGIANTLALSIIERTRELGMMRAVGMTRSQLRSMIRWESVIIAIQGTLLGIVVGVFFGWALVTALSDEGIETFRLPVPTLVVIVVLAAFAGVLAAVWPARRAAKLDVLRAVVTE
ncbi:MAG TPA: FtsX-like permease family protein [Acidimicrobiales bacterium]|nr:FtsX-like permease family protein [Acidimicrobiales bacterium]